MNRKIGKEFRTLLKKKLRQGDKYVALKTAFKTVKFYAARQGLQVRSVVSGCVLQLNLVDETGTLCQKGR